MRGVGDELTHLFFGAFLDVEGLLDLLEHDVDGIGELAHLGALLALGDAAREVAVGDRMGCALDPAKGLERRTDGKQRRERADDDNRCARQSNDPGDSGDRRIDGGQGERDDHRPDRRSSPVVEVEGYCAPLGSELRSLDGFEVCGLFRSEAPGVFGLAVALIRLPAEVLRPRHVPIGLLCGVVVGRGDDDRVPLHFHVDVIVREVEMADVVCGAISLYLRDVGEGFASDDLPGGFELVVHVVDEVGPEHRYRHESQGDDDQSEERQKRDEKAKGQRPPLHDVGAAHGAIRHALFRVAEHVADSTLRVNQGDDGLCLFGIRDAEGFG